MASVVGSGKEADLGPVRCWVSVCRTLRREEFLGYEDSVKPSLETMKNSSKKAKKVPCI